MRILLVDDEVEMTQALSKALQRQGYQVEIANDGTTGQQLATECPHDLLILDWMLPEISGLEICQDLRSRGDTTPVLFLTAKDLIDDRVAGLDAGADDYLVKPFELKELLARVRALLRRPPTLTLAETSTPLIVEGITLDEASQLAYRGDRSIELSEKECLLLAYLMRHSNQLVTHQELYAALWQDEPKPSSNALVAQIRLLRRKVEGKGEAPLIHTVYGKGYRFGE